MTSKSDNGGATAGPSVRQVITMTVQSPELWILTGMIVLIAAVAQFIGPLLIPIGIASVILLPMIWGLLIGTVASGQKFRPMPLKLQHAATTVMGVAVLFLGARLSFEIGPNVGLLIKAGPALLLQEVGHLFGTIALALPLAVLLKMGPATVGATFSIDRETSFAMVSERYGSDSPQYRGVLSMYVFGTIFGAIVVSLIASLTDSLGIFSPLALAMGSGVGSGSMMAAAASVIVASHPELQQQVLALAAASNLITGILGLYVGVWVSLPLADKLYKLLTRNSSDGSPLPVKDAEQVRAAAAAMLEHPTTKIPLWTSLLVIAIAGLVVAMIAAKGFSVNMIITYVILCGLVALSFWVAEITNHKVPGIVVVMTVGALLTSPISPIAHWLEETAKSVQFLSIITAMLTIAGLSLGKDLPMLKGIGWRIIPVGIVAIGASFLLSAMVAQFVMGFGG